MPLLLRLKSLRSAQRGDWSRLLLAIRRGAIIGILILGYLYYLEKGRADGACKSCWPDTRRENNCFNGSLDGLIDPHATDDFDPKKAEAPEEEEAIEEEMTEEEESAAQSARCGAASGARPHATSRRTRLRRTKSAFSRSCSVML